MVKKKITIVASKWNAELVDQLVESGKAHLEEIGFTNIKIVRVPGAWELVHAAPKRTRLCRCSYRLWSCN